MNVQSDDKSGQNLPIRLIERSIHYTYLQVLFANAGSSLLAGMFIIGFALKLGAQNKHIGFMTAIPMLFVVFQLLGSNLSEKGVSRKSMTIWLSFANICGWVLIIAIPYIVPQSYHIPRIIVFIIIYTAMTPINYITSNVRQSWLADMVPQSMRGEFFGNITKLSYMVILVFPIFGSLYLDFAKKTGITAFIWIMSIGTALIFIYWLQFFPQSDVKIKKPEHTEKFLNSIKTFFRNKALLIVTFYGIIWILQTMGEPFAVTYVLRDIKVPFLGFALVSAVSALGIIISSSFWGRMVDRYGAKPVIIFCSFAIAPLCLLWIWIDSPISVYVILTILKALQGLLVPGISIGLNAIFFKVTDNDERRPFSIAIYTILTTLVSAPMPAIGGYIPDWLKLAGINADLRCIIWIAAFFIFVGGFIARKLIEKDSKPVQSLIRNLYREIFHKRKNHGGIR